MNRWLILASGALLLATTSCANVYKKIDQTADGNEERFLGIRQYLSGEQAELHVLQTHGMGDHRFEAYCAQGSENIRLQQEIAKRLGLVPFATDLSVQEIPIVLGKTRTGAYSTRVYVDSVTRPRKSLYFSCLTWGDASREVKVKMLDLSPTTFFENNEDEKHRALINKQAKRFVNRSFSDPIIYLGAFGSYMRQGVWSGIEKINGAQGANRAKVRALAGDLIDSSRTHVSEIPIVVISDSLGSRVLFDVLCANGTSCGPVSTIDNAAAVHVTEQAKELADSTRRSIQGVFMFANQLPLLELSAVEPPPPIDIPIDEWLENQPCHIAFSRRRYGSDAGDGQTFKTTTVVAFTDVNDALSYHLGEKFKDRCSPENSGLRIVNVTIPNAKLRYFGVYSSLGKAHASGFKGNSKAISYVVDGN